jgi:rhodanese-related sulfurtransferase
MNKKLVVWIVAGVLVAGGLALALTPKGGSTAVTGSWPESRNVSNAELKDFVARGARLIDVRTEGEFTAGHIDGAENVPVGDVTSGAGSWDKTAPIVVYCQTGARSLNAVRYLQAQGFEHVYDLPGGVSGWDGALVQGAGAQSPPGGSAKAPALGRPIMYDFASAT